MDGIIDENHAEYLGSVYVASPGKRLSCEGCAGRMPQGTFDLAFCNAMPDCNAEDRRDDRDVVFVMEATAHG